MIFLLGLVAAAVVLGLILVAVSRFLAPWRAVSGWIFKYARYLRPHLDLDRVPDRTYNIHIYYYYIVYTYILKHVVCQVYLKMCLGDRNPPPLLAEASPWLVSACGRLRWAYGRRWASRGRGRWVPPTPEAGASPSG